MRVTWLCLEWPVEGQHTGGVGRYVSRLAQDAKDRVDLTVVALEGAVPVNGVRMETVPASTSRLKRYYVLPWRSRALMAKTAPDLIHAHGDDWALDAHVPVVRSFYGTSASEASSSTGLRKWNHQVLARLEHRSARRAALRLAIAPESAEVFDCHYLMPPLAGLRDPYPRDPTVEPSFVFIGSHQGRKRGWLAARVVEAVRSATGLPVSLTVVGPRHDRESWADWVDHRSGLNDAEVQRLLSRAWGLLAPSAYEGFGIPAVEALHQGCAVLASVSHGTIYLSEQAPSETPLYLAPDDELQHAASHLIALGPHRSRQQQDAVTSLLAVLSAASSPQRLVEHYERVLQGDCPSA